MNIEQARQLKAGDILNPAKEHANATIVVQLYPGGMHGHLTKVFPKGIYNRDGSLLRYVVSSVKTWKRDPERIQIKAKRGMYEFVTLDETSIKYVVKGG